jgi:hypothetical protein
MPKRKGPSRAPYKVGYGRPPEETQFVSGKSGNPKGRPKRGLTLGAMMQQIIGQKVTVTEDGRTRKVAAIEVTLLKLRNDAMRGDPRAVKLLLSLVDRYTGSPETAIRLADLLDEDREILKAYSSKHSDSKAGSGLKQPKGRSNHDDA